MNKKIVILLLGLCLLTACGGSKSAYDEAPQVATEEAKLSETSPEESMSSSNNFDLSSMEQSDQNKKIITTAVFSVETKTFDEDVAKLQKSIKEFGGTIDSINIEGRKPSENHPYDRRYATISYKVPQDKLQAFVDVINSMSVVNQMISSFDATRSYQDNELRLESLRKQHDRILDLISSAETIEAVVVLEQRASEIEYEINSLTRENRQTDYLSQNVSVELSINEIAPTNRLTQDTTLSSRIGEAFNRMVYNTQTFFEQAILFSVVNLPLIIILIVVAGIVVVMSKNKKKWWGVLKTKKKSVSETETVNNKKD